VLLRLSVATASYRGQMDEHCYALASRCATWFIIRQGSKSFSKASVLPLSSLAGSRGEVEFRSELPMQMQYQPREESNSVYVRLQFFDSRARRAEG